MKKLLIIMLFMFICSQCLAITPSIDNKSTYKNSSYRWTGKPKDKILKWAQAMEDAIDGTAGFDLVYFAPGGQPASTEGYLYYDAATKGLKLRTDSAWLLLEAGGAGVSLDGSYDLGSSITVDSAAVALTSTDALNAAVLTIDQVDTGAYNAFTLTGDATEALIFFNQDGSGGDMEGSDDTWSISKVGAFVIKGSLTFETADVLFDSGSGGEDIQFDEDAQMMHYLDGAILGIGGSVNAAADMTFESDGTDVLVEVATQDDADLIFGSTDAFDFKIHANTATDYATFDSGSAALIMTDYDIWFDDTAELFFGGTKNVGFVLGYDSSKVMSLVAGAATDDFAFNIGANSAGIDVQMYGTTASTTCTWDAGADTLIFNGGDLRLQHNDILAFGDSEEMTFAFDGSDLDVLGSGLEISWGLTDEGIDMIWHGEAAGDYMMWDEGIDCLLFEDSHIKFDDDAVFYIGTKTNNQALDGDFKMESISDSRMNITSTAVDGQVCIGDGSIRTDFLIDNITTAGADIWFDASAESNAGTFFLGIDDKGIDTKFFGDAASSYMLWDMSVETLKMVDSDILLDNESLFIDIIDTTGTQVELGTPFYIIFKPAADETLTYTVPAAYDLLIIDCWGYKTVGAGANADDEWNLFNNEGGATPIFDQVELFTGGVVADGDRVAFTGYDDAAAEVEGGQVLSLDADENAAGGTDGTIVVSCVLKLTD